MVAVTPLLDPVEFAARLAVDDEELVDGSSPILFLDLSPRGAPPFDAGSIPAVLVGVGPMDARLALAMDVVTDDERVIGAIAAGVARSPLAAVTLALLLRGRDGRTVDEALVAESAAYSLLQAGPEFAAWRAADRHSPPPPDPDPPVLVRRDGDNLRVTLNRPGRHNAYSMSMRDALVEALRLAGADPALHVVLDGAGPSFSSGGELGEFGTFGDPATAHTVRLTRSAARLLARLSERVEARMHGVCLGAGVELPAFARRVVAHPDTTFGLPELALGLVPGAGGTASLPPRIGRQRTARLALTGERIDAATALSWGLVDEISR